MILKNFFGKTIEAAKKSARQMYGDDFLLVSSEEGDDQNPEARVTVATDGRKDASASQQKAASSAEGGVKFERSSSAPVSNHESTKLNSLRKYAEKQVAEEEARKNGSSNNNMFKMDLVNAKAEANEEQEYEDESESATDTKENTNSKTMYSRAVVRSPKASEAQDQQTIAGIIEPEAEPEQKEEASFRELSAFRKEKNSGGKFITHFRETKVEDQPETSIPPVVQSSRKEQREIKALHKRFDKLEALLDSAFISANLDYASHPAFQQLVHTGINTSVIAGWFSEIIEKGIDPYDQSELFMSKLAGIIRKALGTSSDEAPQKFMLFAGPSGAGKTHLIMKLSQHPDFMLDKKVAVVSVYPQDNSSKQYYTILEAYCKDNDLPYFRVKNNMDVTKHVDEWKEFDHVLIDTPSLSTEQNNSFREFWKIRQILSPLAPLEVHYVVNASLNRFYFRNSSAKHHPLQPDYVAITHLDEVSQWGPVIPFLQEMGCSARYISSGNSVPNSLNEFNPQWFAQKVLQEN